MNGMKLKIKYILTLPRILGLQNLDLDILNARLTAMRDISDYVGTYYSQDWVSKNILNQTSEERVAQFTQIQAEKEAGILPSEEEGEY